MRRARWHQRHQATASSSRSIACEHVDETGSGVLMPRLRACVVRCIGSHIAPLPRPTRSRCAARAGRGCERAPQWLGRAPRISICRRMLSPRPPPRRVRKSSPRPMRTAPSDHCGPPAATPRGRNLGRLPGLPSRKPLGAISSCRRLCIMSCVRLRATWPCRHRLRSMGLRCQQ